MMKPLKDYYVRYELYRRTDDIVQHVTAGMHPIKSITPNTIEDVVRGVFRLYGYHSPKRTERDDQWSDRDLTLVLGVLEPANELLRLPENHVDVAFENADSGEDYDARCETFERARSGDGKTVELFGLSAERDGIWRLLRKLSRHKALGITDKLSLKRAVDNGVLHIIRYRQPWNDLTYFTVYLLDRDKAGL